MSSGCKLYLCDHANLDEYPSCNYSTYAIPAAKNKIATLSILDVLLEILAPKFRILSPVVRQAPR